MNKKALKILGITALLGAIGYLAYKHFKKSDKKNATANSNGSIGTKRFNYKNWDKNRPINCKNNKGCSNFCDELNYLFDDWLSQVFWSSNVFYGLFFYDTKGVLWFFSIRDTDKYSKKSYWIRQQVPAQIINKIPKYIGGFETINTYKKITDLELSYISKFCDVTFNADTNKLDFNNKGCVIKIKPPKPIKGSSGSGKDGKCALQCGYLETEQAIQECMHNCMGHGGNIAIYKSAIGTSQYNNRWW